MTPVAFILAALLAAVSGPNTCVTCHLARVAALSFVTHVDEWVVSRHAAHDVGCDACHGGDATAPDAAQAHRGLRPSHDIDSTVHWTALPATCGGCHRAETNAFETSLHYELLGRGDFFAPTCTSCHGAMGAALPTPYAFETRCRQCHRAAGDNRAVVGRRQLEDLLDTRIVASRMRREIDGIADAKRRSSLLDRCNQLEATLRGATSGLHAFDVRVANDRLSEARAELAALLVEFAKE